MAMDYDRLLQAAKTLKGWMTPAEIVVGLTKGGYSVSAQTLTNWSSRGVSKEGRLNASRIIGCRPLWVESGVGQMSDRSNVQLISHGEVKSIPIISYVQAGIWRDIVDNNPIGFSDDVAYSREEHGLYTFGLRIIGNSMEPEFREGDVIVVDPDVAPNPGDYVVARNHVEAATFKKYRPRGVDENGHPIFELVPLNDDYAVMRSDQEPIQIIGTMVEHTRFRKR